MQAELELQIATVIREVDGANKLGASTLAVYIATALLSRFVLCEKEPVAERYGITYTDGSVQWDASLTEHGVTLCESSSGDPFPKPLYAPADIGKEGGE